MKILKYFFYFIFAVFIAIQFVPNKLPQNNDDLSNDISQHTSTGEDVKLILQRSCYDCHSNQTKYPWYSYVAPVSWLIAKDTRHGREELNFSDWNALSKRKKIKALNDMSEEVEEKKMPLDIYTLVHKDAKLSDDEIILLLNWSKSLSNELLGAN